MPERDPEPRAARPVLVSGSGPHARELAALLATFSSLDREGEPSLEPWTQVRVADLGELMNQRAQAGVLILEAARVPSEDIGLVRRFLERHPERHMVLLGAERDEARALGALTRTRVLAWPPDLEELRALLALFPAEVRGEAREGRSPRRASANESGTQDLQALLEELLAGSALLGGGSVRYHLRGGGACAVALERGALLEGLGGLVELARRCAGSEGLVRAALDPGPDAVLIGLEFPRASLAEKDLPTLLERAPSGLAAELAQGLGAARAGEKRLRALGAHVELSSGEPGRVRCEVRLPLAPRAPPRPARVGKPEDPFAEAR